MGQISAAISAIIDQFREREFDAHYLAFFECFNQGLYFEAHEVLEKIWLPERNGPKGSIYKGLIQLAGAFVHLQKGRLRPANALFDLASANLTSYQPVHDGLDVKGVLGMIMDWQSALKAAGFTVNPLELRSPPKLELLDTARRP
jgi:predicted metal-dependent hydrolase